MNIHKNSHLLIILFSCNFLIAAQLYPEENFTLKNEGFYFSFQSLILTFHPSGGEFPEIYPLKLDSKAYFVTHLGIIFSIDYYISRKSFARLSISYYRDCAFVQSGFIHLGYRAHIFQKNRHSIVTGLGPTLIFREDWHRFPQYTGDNFFRNNKIGNWQYGFILYGCEIEYLYKISKNTEFQFSLIPGSPWVISFKTGFRIKS